MMELADAPRWLIELGFVAYLLLSIAFVVLERRHPRTPRIGVLAIILLPFLGVLAYLFVGRRPYRRHVRRCRRRRETAAMRGVDVRLLVPGVSDQTLVRFASSSYYDELLASGCPLHAGPRNRLPGSSRLCPDSVVGLVLPGFGPQDLARRAIWPKIARVSGASPPPWNSR